MDDKIKLMVSWFPGCADSEVLNALRNAGCTGIAMRNIDNEAEFIKQFGFIVNFHLPAPAGELPKMNLASGDVLQPYQKGKMKGILLSDMPYISYHLGYSCLEVEKKVGPDIALSPTISRQEAFDRICSSITELKRLSGKQILVENLDYGSTGALEYVCEPEFIRSVCEETKCGLLWDIAHAMISASPMGMSLENYMNSFIDLLSPFVTEIHINHPCNGIDAHLPVTDIELRWLSKILSVDNKISSIVLEQHWGEINGIDFAGILVSELEKIKAVVN